MRQVELIEGLRSSALGFGCAPILGSVGASAARRALDSAFDHGITHYDLARSYGYGEAEKFVGKVFRQRRDKVVLSTKFGIEANWKAKILSPLKPLARSLKSEFKTREERVSKSMNIADRFHNRIVLNTAQMLKNVDQSLRALNTDYLDYLFVHEPVTTIINFDELYESAEMLKARGKIRGFGIAFYRTHKYLHQSYLEKLDILQFDNSPGAEGYVQSVSERGKRSNIIFSPLKSGDNTLAPKAKLEKLFADFPESVILCSMFREEHIKQNTELLRQSSINVGN
ncbi:aldo/keto reductase [Flavihumibacter sp. R14]|nr:aldo/keto reductase [Flavihumibacter soli]